MAMKCPNCGYDNAEGAPCCTLCQAVLRKEPTTVAETKSQGPGPGPVPGPRNAAASAGSSSGDPALDAIEAILKAAQEAALAGAHAEAKRLATKFYREVDPAWCKKYVVWAGDLWLDSVKLAEAQAAAARKCIAEGAELVGAERFGEAFGPLRLAVALGKDAPRANIMLAVLIAGLPGAEEYRQWRAEYKALTARGSEAMARPGGEAEAFSCFQKALAMLPDPPTTDGERTVRGRLEALLEKLRQAAAQSAPPTAAASPAGPAPARSQAPEASRHFSRGIELYQGGRPGEALPFIDKAIELDPGNFDFWEGKAVVLGALSRFEDALACNARALELQPAVLDCWETRAVLFRNLGKPGEAAQCLKRATELSPSDPRLWRERGWACGLAGRLQEAEDCLARSLELSPDDPEVLIEQAVVMDRNGKREQALAFAARILQVPGHAAALKAKGPKKLGYLVSKEMNPALKELIARVLRD